VVRLAPTSFRWASPRCSRRSTCWLQSARDERLTDEVVASHVRAAGQHLVRVASSDHTVGRFLVKLAPPPVGTSSAPQFGVRRQARRLPALVYKPPSRRPFVRMAGPAASSTPVLGRARLPDRPLVADA
jgi:hypothetical protein